MKYSLTKTRILGKDLSLVLSKYLKSISVSYEDYSGSSGAMLHPEKIESGINYSIEFKKSDCYFSFDLLKYDEVNFKTTSNGINFDGKDGHFDITVFAVGKIEKELKDMGYLSESVEYVQHKSEKSIDPKKLKESSKPNMTLKDNSGELVEISGEAQEIAESIKNAELDLSDFLYSMEPDANWDSTYYDEDIDRVVTDGPGWTDDENIYVFIQGILDNY